MAVKMISADTLRAALGADASSAVRVASIHAAVCARVKRYAKNAPTEVKNEAAILMAGLALASDRANRGACSRMMRRARPSTCRARFCYLARKGSCRAGAHRARGRVSDDALAVATRSASRASQLVLRPSRNRNPRGVRPARAARGPRSRPRRSKPRPACTRARCRRARLSAHRS